MVINMASTSPSSSSMAMTIELIANCTQQTAAAAAAALATSTTVISMLPQRLRRLRPQFMSASTTTTTISNAITTTSFIPIKAKAMDETLQWPTSTSTSTAIAQAQATPQTPFMHVAINHEPEQRLLHHLPLHCKRRRRRWRWPIDDVKQLLALITIAVIICPGLINGNCCLYFSLH